MMFQSRVNPEGRKRSREDVSRRLRKNFQENSGMELAERVGFVPVVPSPFNNLSPISIAQTFRNAQNLSIRYKTGTAETARTPPRGTHSWSRCLLLVFGSYAMARRPSSFGTWRSSAFGCSRWQCWSTPVTMCQATGKLPDRRLNSSGRCGNAVWRKRAMAPITIRAARALDAGEISRAEAASRALLRYQRDNR